MTKKTMKDKVSRYLGTYDNFDNAVLARLAAEQCLGWAGCDNSSPAYKYAKNHELLQGGV